MTDVLGTTTASVQRYLDDLAHLPGDSPAEPVVRGLLARAVDRLHEICARLLYQGYPRLARGPLNLCAEDLLGAVVERLLKAMRQVHPGTVRQFFALANQHMRWELNDLARRLDHEVRELELRDSGARAPAPGPAAAAEAALDGAEPRPSECLSRILAALDQLPADEREVFDLVRIQGTTHVEAAQVIGASVKTVGRRLNRALVMLGERLGDLVSGALPTADSAAQA